MPKRMLITFAHPDDESFGIGSLIAKYVAEGTEVTLICSTNGDVGTISPEHMQGHDSIASVRLSELQCAADVLGFKEVITFDYRDSGMMGSTDNQHADCLWSAPLDEVTQKITEVMQRIRPQVVITFDPFGGYGHPDHIKMNQATLAAFDKLKSEIPDLQKLYYPSFPRALIRFGVMVMRLMGKDPRHTGTNKDMDFQAVLDATLPTHTKIDVSKYYEVGQRAAACHRSQSSPRQTVPFGDLLMRQLMRYSALTRVVPAPKANDPVEHDLFQGVTVT
jgi:LmbE family N-acetylglucosaminyl deacetylase